MSEDDRVKLTIIITLGVVLIASVMGVTIIAIATDRDLHRAGTLLFGEFILILIFGGLVFPFWKRRRHRKWHVEVDRNDKEET